MSKHYFMYSAAVFIAILASLSGLIVPAVEGLDSSHNVMDGLFFYDLFKTDLWSMTSLNELAAHPATYHSQYPALGFVYWPPFWPLIESFFFFVFGTTLLASQMSVTLFTIIFAITFTAVVSRIASTWTALASLVLLLSSEEIWLASNTIMRDMPALGMMMLSFWCCVRWMEDGHRTRWLWIFLAISIASIYTKQTTVLVHIALAAGALIHHPKILKKKSTWAAAITLLLCITPLIIFTLTIASDNLGQSFGNNTQAIMKNYDGLARWSIDSWLFYPRWLLNEVTGIAVAALLSLAFLILQRWFNLGTTDVDEQKGSQKIPAPYQFILTTSMIWALLFYVLFSYFDNKTNRFGTLWLPPLAILIAYTLERMLTLLKINRKNPICAGLIIVIALPSFLITAEAGVPKVTGVDNIVVDIIYDTKARSRFFNTQACFYYHGQFRQIFAQALRRQDPSREVAIKAFPKGDISALDLNQCTLVVVETDSISASTAKILVFPETTRSFSTPKRDRVLKIMKIDHADLIQ